MLKQVVNPTANTCSATVFNFNNSINKYETNKYIKTKNNLIGRFL